MLLRRFNQFPPDAATLLIAMDCHLPNVQGVGRHFSIQKSRNPIALRFRDNCKAFCDQGAMLFL